MSVRDSSVASSAIGTDRAAYSSASRSALPSVRLTTAVSAAPRRVAVETASEAIAPAPTTSTRSPARLLPGTAWSRAALTMEGAAWAMSVSAWERLPIRRACWNSTLSAGPTVPSSWPRRSASRVWPRICPSPTTIESSPAETWKRWETAPSS